MGTDSWLKQLCVLAAVVHSAWSAAFSAVPLYSATKQECGLETDNAACTLDKARFVCTLSRLK